MHPCTTCGAEWTTAEGAAGCCICPRCKKRPRRRRIHFCSVECLIIAFNGEVSKFRERDRSRVK